MTSLIPAGVLTPVRSKCAEVVAAHAGITHVYGYNTIPDHNNQRCIDFMTPTKAIGDAIAAYLIDNWTRLGVRVIIWWGRIWRSYDKLTGSRSPGRAFTWAPYNEANQHKDHVHAEFNSAAYVPPTAAQAPIPTVWMDRLVPGVTDSDSVRAVQRALGITATGTYDSATVAAVKARQVAWGDAPQFCDGVLGPKQASQLFATAAMVVEIRTDPSGQAPSVPPIAMVTVVSANVLRRTDPDKTRKPWSQRVANIVAHIRSGSPTIVLLQEVDSVTAADIFTRLGPSWHYDRCRGLAIGWYSPELERVGDAQCVLYPDRDNRYRHSVQLRHRASGQVLWADCTHLENDGDPTTDGHRARHVEISAFVAGTKTGKRVFGGDMNSTTPSTAAATERQRQKPRPVLRGAGWWLLTDQTDVTDRALESHHGGNARDGAKGPWIDDAGGKGVTYVAGSGQLIRTDKTDASDHHFLRFQAQI